MDITTRDLEQRGHAYSTLGFVEARVAPTDTSEGGQGWYIHGEEQKSDLGTPTEVEYIKGLLHSPLDQWKERVPLPTIRQEQSPHYSIGIYSSAPFSTWPYGRIAILDKRSHDIDAVEASLRKIADLPPNWDSYSAPRIASHVIDEARSILLCVAALGLPQPWVAPGADGGIGIQWDSEVAELYIDIVPGEPTSYLLTLNVGSSKEVEVDEPLTLTNLSRILTQFAEAIR